jgi:hypothetical protein
MQISRIRLTPISSHNSSAERALRAVALGRRNYLFAGDDCGGDV